MRAIGVTLILLATVLAGCADGDPPKANEEDETFEDLGGEATATTGLIRGVVFDDTITPIEGVTVRIKSVDRETKTNEAGAFVIDGLEEGFYFLDFRKVGFDQVQQQTEVKAGVAQPPAVKVQLQANPSSLPDIVPHTFQGYIVCSFVAVALALAACSVPYTYAGVDLGDQFITFIDTNGYPDFIQGEAVWKSTQTLGSALAFSVFDGSLTAPIDAIGTSPQVIGMPRDFWENGTGSQKSGSPMIDEGERFSWRVFAGGTDETRGTLIWGVGVTVEQDFDIYTHMFWNMVPEEDWQFSIDGDHPMPE